MNPDEVLKKLLRVYKANKIFLKILLFLILVQLVVFVYFIAMASRF